jgi:hypothetical protein
MSYKIIEQKFYNKNIVYLPKYNIYVLENETNWGGLHKFRASSYWGKYKERKFRKFRTYIPGDIVKFQYHHKYHTYFRVLPSNVAVYDISTDKELTDSEIVSKPFKVILRADDITPEKMKEKQKLVALSVYESDMNFCNAMTKVGHVELPEELWWKPIRVTSAFENIDCLKNLEWIADLEKTLKQPSEFDNYSAEMIYALLQTDRSRYLISNREDNILKDINRADYYQYVDIKELYYLIKKDRQKYVVYDRNLGVNYVKPEFIQLSAMLKLDRDWYFITDEDMNINFDNIIYPEMYYRFPNFQDLPKLPNTPNYKLQNVSKELYDEVANTNIGDTFHTIITKFNKYDVHLEYDIFYMLFIEKIPLKNIPNYYFEAVNNGFGKSTR